MPKGAADSIKFVAKVRHFADVIYKYSRGGRSGIGISSVV